MWFLVLLPMTVSGIASTLFAVTKGMNFVIAGSALIQWQRYKGFKPHEGGLTFRENAVPYGVSFDENSEHDVSRNLALLSKFAPQAFEPFLGKKYDMTHSEGQMIRAIIEPAVRAVVEVQSIGEAYVEDQQNEELRDLFFAASANVGSLISPVIEFLRQFPKNRVKKVNEKDSNRRHSWLYRRIRKTAEGDSVQAGIRPADPTG